MVDSQIVIFFGQDCGCSRDMKFYYLCFKKEALIVQETFLYGMLMLTKIISILCHSTLHPVNIHIKRPNDRKTHARCKSGRGGQRGSGYKA